MEVAKLDSYRLSPEEMDMGKKTTNPDLSAALIGLIGTRGPMSRTDAARHLGVSPATVTNVTKPLLAQGTLIESGTQPSAGGRPSVLLDVVQQRRYALGVKLTPNHLTMAEVDINGAPSPGESVDLDMRSPGAFEQIAHIIGDRVRDRTGLLLGIGLALPGFSDPENPDIVTAPTLGWDAVDLGRLLRTTTGLPVIIDNDVNALAVADQLYGENHANNRLLVTIGYGIGAALTADGRVLRGAHGGAGEFGHSTARASGLQCTCGLYDCLETLISDNALVRRARESGSLEPHQGKRQLNDLAEAGHPGARALFHDAGISLGIAVANIVHLFDPETITISGEGVDMWHHWESGFLEGLHSRLPENRRSIPVDIHPWTDDTWAHGAASLVFALPLAHLE
ncbi:ROK family transcriptional regulator [Trueperella pyogenes]|nr:ROK family transcriptional regulator [Trueperella pyogenes]